MADIIPNSVAVQKSLALSEGQRIQIRVLNADGSVSSTICDDSCPSGKSLSGQTFYGGTLE